MCARERETVPCSSFLGADRDATAPASFTHGAYTRAPGANFVKKWLSCHTQDEIAERESVSVQVVKDVVSDISAELPKHLKPAADHLADFEPPIYNVWKWQDEIAAEVDCSKMEVSRVCNEMADLPKSYRPPRMRGREGLAG